jgi:hypothetical protein
LNNENISKIKYTLALVGRQSTMVHTKTNKKQATATERVWRGCLTRQEAGGKYNTIGFGA